MKSRRSTSLILALLAAAALYLNRGALLETASAPLPGKAPAVASSPGTAKEPLAESPSAWPTPTEADLARYKAEKGMKVTESALRKMQEATVERVVDGDTVALKISGKSEKVRLLNVNTPETVDPRKPVEEYGKEASAFAKAILPPGTKVYVKPDVEERDRYDRLLLHLYLGDGTWFNALLIRAGYAQVMTISPNVSASAFFKELQAKAREEEVGLWQIPLYQQPAKK